MNERLKSIRKILGLTQQEFADRLGVKRNTVATYEVGKSNPSDAAVLLICREFNVNETWLRTGEGEMFEELTEQEKTMKYVARLLKDVDSKVASAIKAFIVTYGELDDTSKKVLDSTLDKFLDNLKKGQ